MASHIEHIDGKVQISTARLLLRPAEENDAESLYDILGDPKVMAYWYSNSDRKEGVCLLLWLGASFRMRI
jgi:RimJ/RimL family protein N-acetyltransferase